jgi:hypothetical protein
MTFSLLSSCRRYRFCRTVVSCPVFAVICFPNRTPLFVRLIPQRI